MNLQLSRMQLIIDSGNTKTKFALYQKHQEIKTLSVFNALAEATLIELIESHKINTCILSSVSLTHEPLKKILSNHIQELYDLNDGLNYPIDIAYLTPQTLGKDRIAMACAANKQFKHQSSLIISFGSCVTYNFISQDAFHGGAISPGVFTRFKSLNQDTANLPLIETLDTTPQLGKNTHQSITSGVLNGIAHEVQGFIDYYKENHGLNNVIFCGADAFYFDRVLKSANFVEPNYVIRGLKCILEQQQ